MQKILGAFFVATIFTFLTVAPALAQTKPLVKLVLDNANVQVRDVTYSPGSSSPIANRPHLVVYVIAGPQKFKYTYADGHSTTVTRKTGDVFWQEAATRSITNVGTNTVRTLVIYLKK
jgi:quercetin dioxygenase-like cupin family protein